MKRKKEKSAFTKNIESIDTEELEDYLMSKKVKDIGKLLVEKGDAVIYDITNKNYRPGDIMIIKDHISFFIRNPLIGENIDELGTRFPDMTDVYDKDMIKVIEKVATKNKIKLQKGVYIQLTGPSSETATEVKLLGKLGADAVGMSTVIEVIAARHAGLKIAGLSVITNMGTGLSKLKLSDDDVRETANKIAKKFERLVVGIISNLK